MKKSVKKFAFRIHKMSNINEKTKRKQNELLRNALGVMAAELVDVQDSFHQGRQCSAHAQMQSSQIWVSRFSLQINPSEFGIVSFFSSSPGLPIGVNHTINQKIEKFDIFIFTSKHMDKKKQKFFLT